MSCAMATHGKALDNQLLEKNCYIKELEDKLSHIDKNTIQIGVKTALKSKIGRNCNRQT